MWRRSRDSLRDGITAPLTGLLVGVGGTNPIGKRRKDVMNAHSLIRKTLITLSIAAACGSAVPVAAATPITLHRSLAPQFQVAGEGFDVNERTGRVRLTFDVFDFTWESNLIRTELVDVPGLRFDRERREVVYENEGLVTTCARPKKFLWSTTYPATDACRIIVRRETQTAGADSGTSVGTDWAVELVTNEPTKSARLSR
jgi:hypothetical protein